MQELGKHRTTTMMVDTANGYIQQEMQRSGMPLVLLDSAQ
jgi:hypothetical protein